MALTTHLIILMHFCTILAISSNALTPKISSILVFGDSTVDTGNNNYIKTLIKGNHFPYGKDFPGHVATGRFSNGKLVPDFVASTLNIKDTVPPFLDPSLSDEELVTGVSFASAGSGYDGLTTAALGVIPMSKQIEYFKAYLGKLKRISGENEVKKIIRDALVVFSAGTNDFAINFYDIPTRRLKFNISGYHDFLQKRLQILIKKIYRLGCRKIAVTGLPPIGCLPLQITVKFENPKDRKCLEEENSDAQIYNQKLMRLLRQMQTVLPGSRIIYADIYEPLMSFINQPQKYGFEVTKKGCCGTGFSEVGPFCNELTPTCENPSKYVFWDSVHPTEAANRYIAKYFEIEILPKFQYNISQT